MSILKNNIFLKRKMENSTARPDALDGCAIAEFMCPKPARANGVRPFRGAFRKPRNSSMLRWLECERRPTVYLYGAGLCAIASYRPLTEAPSDHAERERWAT
jgi:hypothetical protein